MTSVIIRLQNLPWSANALDIRKFFVGLCIPDGGVHIVGGEMGDAFIAFSTDEDARRSMMLDRGKINQTQIRLFLSSRAEMQTVIENARKESLKKQLNAVLSNTIKMQGTVTPQSPLVTSSTLQNILSTTQNSLIINTDKSDNDYSNVRKARERERLRTRLRDSHSSSTSSERHRSRSRRSRDTKNYRSSRRSSSQDHSRERERNRVRASGRNRDSSSSDRSQSSSSIDSQKKIINDLEKQNRSRKSDIIPSGTHNQQLSSNQELKSYDLTVESDMEKSNCEERNQFGKENLVGSPQSQFNINRSLPYFQQNDLSSQNIYISGNNYVTSKDSNNDLNDNNAVNINNSLNSSNFSSLNLLSSLIPNITENKLSNAFQNPYKSNMPVSNWNTTSNTSSNRNNVNSNDYPCVAYVNTSDRNLELINSACVKVSNMLPTTSYNDIRRFFTGIVIPQKGIKILNNNHGNRVGIALVNFNKSEFALKAMALNNNYLKSQKVSLVKILDKEFEDAIDSFRPPPRNSMLDKNRKNSLGQTKMPLLRQENSLTNNRNNANKNVKNEIPLTVLRLEDLPPFAREQDVMKMFGSYTILDIIVTRTTDKEYVAFVKFHRSDDAKAALNDRSQHLIGHRQICAKPSTENELERAREEKNKLIQKAMIDDEVKEKAKKIEIEMEMEIERSRFISSMANFNQPNDDNLSINSNCKQALSTVRNDSNNIKDGISKAANYLSPNQNTPLLNSNDSGIPSLLTLDSSTIAINPNFQNRQPMINHLMKTPGYVLARNLDYKVTDREIGEYFLSQNMCPLRVEVLMNSRGLSSGDAIIEFSSIEAAQNALKVNNQIFNGRKMHVATVTREAIDRRLGVNFLRNQNLNNNFQFGMVDNRVAFANRSNFHGLNAKNGSQNSNFNKSRNGNGIVDGNLNDNFRGRQNFNSNNRSNDNSLPTKTIPDEFTRRGSILILENVPYKASINDIIEFFAGYNITGPDIIRRYNDNGTPTGDARVDLRTAELARSALESKKGKRIHNRTIYIKLL